MTSTRCWISSGRTHAVWALASAACLVGVTETAAANVPPSTPTLVAPASGATLSADGPQLFSIRTADPDGDPYAGWVTVTSAATGRVVTRFATTPSSSGETSSGIPFMPLPPGSYLWSASASDLPLGAASPESGSRSLTVAGSSNLGGGAFTGTVSQSAPPPPLGGTCRSTSFSVNATAAAAVVTFAPTEFLGFLNFNGSGGSSCETFATGTGTLQLSASGLGVGATTLTCSSLTGAYTRVGPHVRALVSGACTLNGTGTDTVSFDIEATLADGAFDGEFTVSPAG